MRDQYVAPIRDDTHDTMVEGVPDPVEKGDRREEVVLLAQLVQLRIPIEHTRRDKLVKDANDQWWEDGENDVVVRH